MTPEGGQGSHGHPEPGCHRPPVTGHRSPVTGRLHNQRQHAESVHRLHVPGLGVHRVRRHHDQLSFSFSLAAAAAVSAVVVVVAGVVAAVVVVVAGVVAVAAVVVAGMGEDRVEQGDEAGVE
jgi:hypothetical protein